MPTTTRLPARSAMLLMPLSASTAISSTLSYRLARPYSSYAGSDAKASSEWVAKYAVSEFTKPTLAAWVPSRRAFSTPPLVTSEVTNRLLSTLVRVSAMLTPMGYHAPEVPPVAITRSVACVSSMPVEGLLSSVLSPVSSFFSPQATRDRAMTSASSNANSFFMSFSFVFLNL